MSNNLLFDLNILEKFADLEEDLKQCILAGISQAREHIPDTTEDEAKRALLNFVAEDGNPIFFSLEYRKNGDLELYIEDIELLSTDEYLDLLNEQKSELDLNAN